jgi:hypothetical protein
MKYNVEQRVFMYDTFVKYSSWRKCCRKFRRKYPDVTLPCKATIYNVIEKCDSAVQRLSYFSSVIYTKKFKFI